MKYFSPRIINNDKKTFQMIKLLIINNKLTTSQLAHLLQVSPRQITDYKKYINDCLGVKIKTVYGNQGGYSLKAKQLNKEDILYLRDKLPEKLFNKVYHINKLVFLFGKENNNGISN